MSTSELPREKRIADELSIPDEMVPEVPPVHPEPLLNDHEPDEMSDEPPCTRLLLEGLDHAEITAEFLADLHDLADDHDLPVESISVGRPDD